MDELVLNIEVPEGNGHRKIEYIVDGWNNLFIDDQFDKVYNGFVYKWVGEKKKEDKFKGETEDEYNQ